MNRALKRRDSRLILDVTNRIRKRILDGTLAPGDHLHQAALAEEFGVSRTPIREALSYLEAERLVVGMGQGMGVRKASNRELAEFGEMRLILEPLAVEMACRNVGSDGRDKVRRMATEADNVEGGALRNTVLNFHRAICLPCGNAMMMRVLEQIWTFSGHVERMDVKRSQSLSHEHHEIAEAFFRGDAQAAGQLTEQHLRALGYPRRPDPGALESSEN